MLDFENIDLNCPKTWRLLCSGDTKGVFQLESRLGQSMSKKLKPENIEQLAALISIMRPGCISGDTKIFIHSHPHSCDGRMRFKKARIRDIASNPEKFSTLLSYNEQTGKVISNQMLNAFYNGDKECFKIILKTNDRKKCKNGFKDYKLECTADHQLLTPDGWKKLQDIKIGERVLTNKRKGTQQRGLGQRSFRDRCFEIYHRKCIFCDWNKGTPDVNHINGNKFINNDSDNLCYLCPNHHREFTEGSISVETINEYRLQHKLPDTIDGKWCQLVDKISVGIKDVYDISMKSPHNNFIAGGIIVHNCLEAVRDGKTVSNHFIDKKNGLESIDYFNSALEPILKKTYGEMVYQEQAMEIAKEIAGFDLQEADMLRKAIGKKKPEEMAKVKTLFIQKSREANIVNENEAEQIFSWIEKSQRYSFNKSHAISYALNSYVSAYAKAHHPHEFFTSYLKFSKDKIDPMREVYELVNNAISNNINIYRPDLRKLNKDFILDNKIIYFGLTNIKGIGDSVFTKLLSIIESNRIDLNTLNVNQVLFVILDNINNTAAKALISVGAVDYLKISRKRLLFYLDIIQNLSPREKQIILNNFDMKDSLEKIFNGLISMVNKKRSTIISSLVLAMKQPAYSLDDDYEWIANVEKQYLGISITCSVVDGRDLESANTDCKTLSKSKIISSSIIVGAEINEISIIKTKKGANPGQEMAFLKISDGTGSCDLVIFPKEYSQYKSLLYPNNTIMFSLEQSKNKDSLIIKKIWQI